MAPSATYAIDERSKGVRLAQRTQSDIEAVQRIVNETSILHVSFNAPLKEPPQFPTVLPMLGAFGTYGDEEDASIYLHGSSVARLFKLTAGKELPLCICATLFDGWVLALAPFHNSCNYRSAVVFGYGTVVTDPDEILFGLKLITNNGVPERWENSRAPPTKAEITSTGVLKVRVETASVKTRAGGPNDDRADLQDPAVVDKTWIGVVPAYQMLGDPVATEHNKVQLPEYLSDWVADANSMAEQRAVDVVDG